MLRKSVCVVIGPPIALDIWSVGTIMLSCLTGKFPIFNASDDTEALMEIATILGRKKMEKCAQLHSWSSRHHPSTVSDISGQIEPS